MDPLKDYKRTRLPFNKLLNISPDTKEVLLNNYGNVRAILDDGIVIIQTKKLKGQQRELIQIDTNVQPPTLKFIIED
ncbi:MAG: hypothetical protein HZB59_10095 [Ignavibacteriales bacterium]|nr:hypothetical protein [Ignavibacteriales bacterium]